MTTFIVISKTGVETKVVAHRTYVATLWYQFYDAKENLIAAFRIEELFGVKKIIDGQ